MRHAMLLAVFLTLLLTSPAWGQNVYNQVNEAVKAQSAGDLGRAYQLYTRIIESGKLRSDPKILAYLYNNRAVIRLQQGMEGLALEDFERALELHPDHSTYFNRALIMRDRGRTQQALADLNKAIELFPRHAKAHQVRGRLLLEQGETARGRADLKKAALLQLKLHFLGPGEMTAKGHAGMQNQQDQSGAAGGLRQRMRVE